MSKRIKNLKLVSASEKDEILIPISSVVTAVFDDVSSSKICVNDGYFVDSLNSPAFTLILDKNKLENSMMSTVLKMQNIGYVEVQYDDNSLDVYSVSYNGADKENDNSKNMDQITTHEKDLLIIEIGNQDKHSCN